MKFLDLSHRIEDLLRECWLPGPGPRFYRFAREIAGRGEWEEEAAATGDTPSASFVRGPAGYASFRLQLPARATREATT